MDIQRLKKDRLFIQEVLNDLYKNGFISGGKAETMLKDWSRELRRDAGLTGKTKTTFAREVGKENY